MALRVGGAEGLLSGRRVRALARAVRGRHTSFAADCAKALAGLEGRNTPPLELIPLGARVLSRGVLTARVLSVGRERPWPYAFARQLDPEDAGFLPRSLLPLHLNLSYRNWTTVGLPGWPDEAIVDPGGWLTPLRHGPSIAVWVGDSRRLYTLGPLPGWGPDRELNLRQERIGDYPIVRTVGLRGEIEVEVDAFPAVVDGELVFGLTARVRLRAPAPRPVRVGFAIRPSNPEGIAPVFSLARRGDGWWLVDGRPFAYLPHAGDEHRVSSWRAGDVYEMLGGVLRDGGGRRHRGDERTEITCGAGLATGCELYRVNLSPGETFKRTLYAATQERVGAVLQRSSATRLLAGAKADWDGVTRAGARIELPVHGRLFRTCRTTLLSLLDTDQVTPGPFSHHDFWYRDAAFMLAALTRLGYGRRVRRVLESYPGRQARSGAWLSQGSEWDGSGEAIWTITDHVRLTGDRDLLRQLYPSIARAARWIANTHEDGMMPSGWSAEHLGPADRYYWDCIWSTAGLREAAIAARILGRDADHREFQLVHGELLQTLRQRMGEGPVPAAPGRSMDSAAVSVLVAVWPLRVFSSTEPAMRSTVDWLLSHCMHEAGLFHDVVHSGVNTYLTAHLAQTRLLAGDPGVDEHLDYLAEHASPTGCWPEAFHPDRGGVMGDGDHGWAAAEFAMLCRNLVLFENGGTLHLFRGASRRWRDRETVLEGMPTAFGPVDMRSRGGEVQLQGRWRERPNRVLLHLGESEQGSLVVGDRRVDGSGPELELSLG